MCKDSIKVELGANKWNTVNDGSMAAVETNTEKIFRVPGRNRRHDLQPGTLKILS